MKNNLEDLINLLKKLRAPNGCEWDKQQTHDSLIPYLLEEVHEVIEAIEIKDYNLLKEELGDLLLHIVFQAELANEANQFNIYDSIANINNKLINRHPHIFSDKNNIQWEAGNWEKQKQKEKKRNSILDGVPKSLPALTKAQRIQEKAASVGFDWKEINQVFNKLYEEIDELNIAIKENNQNDIEEELGDVLFSIVNLSRHLNINSEVSLDKSIIKFISRFKKLENHIKEKKLDFKKQSLSKLDKLWNEIKINEKSNLK
jgi:tetrapyrrole methylase family protein/MazG family protein